MSSRVPCRTRVLTEGFSVFFFSAAGERCHQLFCVVRQSVHPQWRRIQAGRATSGAPRFTRVLKAAVAAEHASPLSPISPWLTWRQTVKCGGTLRCGIPSVPLRKQPCLSRGAHARTPPAHPQKSSSNPQTIHHSAVPPSSHPDQRPTKTHTSNTKKENEKQARPHDSDGDPKANVGRVEPCVGGTASAMSERESWRVRVSGSGVRGDVSLQRRPFAPPSSTRSTTLCAKTNVPTIGVGR